MKGKLQSDRLTMQQKETDGVLGIFNDDAKNHDKEVFNTSTIAKKRLERVSQAEI